MTGNLRDRRRRETAREIQHAALCLSLRLGYCAVTTEAIAAEAGISTRTFFNYYANKQAAILGVPPQLDLEASAWIVTSRAPLIDDISRLLGEMIGEDRLDRTKLRMIEQVLDRTPELVPLFHRLLESIAHGLAVLLSKRFGPGAEREADLIAALATNALTNAVRLWAGNDDRPEAQVLALLRQQLSAVCDRLCPPTPVVAAC